MAEARPAGASPDVPPPSPARAPDATDPVGEARRRVEQARAELRGSLDRLGAQAVERRAEVRERALSLAPAAAATVAGLILVSALRRRRRRRQRPLLEVGPFSVYERR